MSNQGEEDGVDKKGPTEASLPNSQESNSNVESIIGKSLHVQQLWHIQKLIGMMRSLLSNTSVVFNAVHEEIAAIVARYLDEGGCDSPFLARDPGNAPSPEETARNGRLLTIQLNLARLFNPSILTGGVFSTMSEDLKVKLEAKKKQTQRELTHHLPALSGTLLPRLNVGSPYGRVQCLTVSSQWH